MVRKVLPSLQWKNFGYLSWGSFYISENLSGKELLSHGEKNLK